MGLNGIETPAIKEELQAPKNALDSFSYADISKHSLAIGQTLNESPRAEATASRILGKEPQTNPDINPTTLSNNPQVREIQAKIYTELGINVDTNTNNPFKKLTKGAIDGLIIGNAELVGRIQEEGMEAFLSSLKEQLTTLEGWEKIAKALGTSIMGLVSLDAYKTGKSAAELGLITTGMGAAGSITKMAGKSAVRTSVKIGRETVEQTVASKTLYGIGRTAEVVGDGLQLPGKGVKKAGELTVNGIRTTGGVIGLNSALRQGAEVIKDGMEKAGVGKVVEHTKTAVKRTIQGLGTIHVVGSAEGFPRHPKIIEAGAIFPGGRPSQIKETLNVQDLQRLSDELYSHYSSINTPAHREFLGQISPESILGEGMNGIVVIHPTREGAVVKIAHPRAIHDLGIEASNHNTAYQLLRKGKQEMVIPDTVKIPKIIEHFNETKGYYVMEKLPGQSLHSRFFRETFASHFQKDPKELLDALTDNQLKRRLIDNHRVSAEYVDLAIENLSADYTRNYLANRADYQQAKEYMKTNGFIHPDLHGGNIMVDNNGNLYIIDFGDKPKP